MGAIIHRATTRAKARLVTQLAGLGLLNLSVVNLRSVCIPALNCHSCPAAVFACPVGVFVNFSMLRLIPYLTVGLMGLVGTISGRWVCGWLCPFGLLQDGLQKVRGKMGWLPKRSTLIKYALLVGLVFFVPFLWPNAPATFCHFCPAGTLESAIPWAIMGVSSPWRWSFAMRLGIVLGVVALAVAASRGFCRSLCPLGAILAPFNRVSLLRMRLTVKECTDCGACAKRCPMGIHPVKDINSGECIRCLECTNTKHLRFGVK